eukprot:1326754-Amorphochlora_amoeboformis.AAC.1
MAPSTYDTRSSRWISRARERAVLPVGSGFIPSEDQSKITHGGVRLPSLLTASMFTLHLSTRHFAISRSRFKQAKCSGPWPESYEFT